MNEDFIYYLWTYQLLNIDLNTVDGDEIDILSTGTRNTNSGPDFFNALINIGGTKWAGNVEMHVRSSDWFKHRHQNDISYDNIILHVVFDDDIPIFRKNGELIPTLIIKNKYDEDIFSNYRVFMDSKSSIPCEKQISEIRKIDQIQWFDKLMTERLQEKTNEIVNQLNNTKNDFQQVYYQSFVRSLGYTANSDAMELLSSITPIKLLLKHCNSIFQLEAFLYGQSGLLEGDFKDDYPLKLKEEYSFLRKKYGLTSMKRNIWKFMRMRPASFPTIRISQLANIIFNTSGNITNVFNTNKHTDILSILSVSASPYWNNHYRFDTLTKSRIKKLGHSTINLILINSIIPFMFIFGNLKNKTELQDKSLQWLGTLPSENNRFTRDFISMGIIPENAMNSQAIVQLKTYYCNMKRCLDCKFGQLLLNKLA